jgi:hypothetical protein
MANYLKIALFLLISIQTQISFAQERRIIRVQSGGSVNFPINSLKKYQDGMVLNQWTNLAIWFSDSDLDAKWRLEIKASDSDIRGSFHSLDLGYITILVEDGKGTNELDGYLTKSEIFLTPYFQEIVCNAPQGTFADNKIMITYKLGKGQEDLGDGNILKYSLMNNPPDYYYVDIEFRLSRVE